jgi:molybdopterin-containing oxidoreductase family iron-sulfur binding subunit
MTGKTEKVRLDLEKIRARLDSAKGPQYWKSLEELAETEEFQAYVQDEFPNRTPDWLDPANRRNFLKLMGASLALAGVTACTKQPAEMIVPYVRQPEDFVPGKPLYFATAMTMGGVSTGLLVESHLGRPTKVEGNPDHPGSLGASDFFHQASVLTMYDPDRSQVVINNGHISSWFGAQSALGIAKEKAILKKGAGFRILTESVTSPTLTAQIKAFLKELPEAKWHTFEPAGRIGSTQGAMLAFGRPVNAVYHFDQADVIVSLDADFLACGPGNLRYAREFADRRRVQTNITHSPQPKEDRQEGYQEGPDAPLRNQSAVFADKDPAPLQNPAQVQATGKPLGATTMNRLYVVEPYPTPTGGMADHRYPAKPSDVEAFAAALAAALGVAGAAAGSSQFKDIGAIAKDLQAHRGASIVIAGEFQSPRVHALAHAINQALGNAGKTVVYTEPVEGNPVDPMQSLKQLAADLNAGQVDTLVILGGNPVYNAPVDLEFEKALIKAGTRFHLGLFANETAVLCNWHVPEAHFLESWSDARGHDGTASIVQPLIAPLYGGVTAHQVMSVLAGDADRVPYDIVKPYWQSHMTGDFETAWQTAVHDGVIANTALAAVPVTAKAPPSAAAQQGSGMELIVRPDPTIWDGTWANNGWLQELPKPHNKMTWDNAVWVSPTTAQKLGVTVGDMVELRYRGKTASGPVWIMPGHANDCATVHLGFGRTRAGHVGNSVGFNAYALQTSDAPGGGPGLEIRKIDGHHDFATTQHTQTMEEREPVRMASLEEYKKDPQFVDASEKPIPKWETLYPDYAYQGYKWGMTIDLNACVGCSACITACQSENNIPVVGKIETAKGRHMASWIRVDRYFKGNWDNPEVYFQPVPCMQCENAPCELVCPVAATVHSSDGLNQMIYNRCVGTRYCSNNCPYKVRRFNFLLYSDWYTPSLYPMRNPDVTVRSRGVMEKCSYCVQRINAAKIESEKQNRRIADGEVVPACAQACPTRAIEFGDINDPKSKVAQLKAQPRNYSLLEELNTRPRTTYLGRLRNPNPEIQNG